MKHRHEIESGRTSTATTHLMGFRSSGQAIAGRDQVRANKRKTEDEIARESYRVITLMDLAGHEKYLKTTYVCICVYWKMDSFALVMIWTQQWVVVSHLTSFFTRLLTKQHPRRVVGFCGLCAHFGECSSPTNSHDPASFEFVLQLWHSRHCHFYQNWWMSRPCL